MLRVLAWSQLLGLVLSLVIVPVVWGTPHLSWVALGAAAGVAGGAAIICLYEALKRAPMGIVAPISACSSIIPVGVSLARGESPGSVALAGMVAAIVGVIVVARAEQDHRDLPVTLDTVAILLSIATAIGFGVALTMLDHAAGSASQAQAVWSSTGLRAGSLTLIITLVLIRRVPCSLPGADIAMPVVGIGVCETVANAAFAVAASTGNLAIVAVVSSTYPVTTAVLARVLLGERIVRVQAVGVAVIVVGVALMGLKAT